MRLYIKSEISTMSWSLKSQINFWTTLSQKYPNFIIIHSVIKLLFQFMSSIFKKKSSVLRKVYVVMFSRSWKRLSLDPSYRKGMTDMLITETTHISCIIFSSTNQTENKDVDWLCSVDGRKEQFIYKESVCLQSQTALISTAWNS